MSRTAARPWKADHETPSCHPESVGSAPGLLGGRLEPGRSIDLYAVVDLVELVELVELARIPLASEHTIERQNPDLLGSRSTV